MEVMGEDSIELDTLLDLCGDQHRRIVLATLATEQRPLTIRDLTMTILEHNHQTTVAEASEEAVTRILSSLHHVHVPKLECVGVVDYDPERQLVEPTERFGLLEPALSAILDADSDIEEPITL